MKNSMDCIFVKIGDKTVTLQEFFAMENSSLSENEQKIKQALAYLYEKNNRRLIGGCLYSPTLHLFCGQAQQHQHSDGPEKSQNGANQCDPYKAHILC